MKMITTIIFLSLWLNIATYPQKNLFYTLTQTFNDSSGLINTISITQGLILSASSDSKIRSYIKNPVNYELYQTFNYSTFSIWGLVASKNGSFLYASDQNRTLAFYRKSATNSSYSLTSSIRLNSISRSLSITNDGNQLAMGKDNGQCQVLVYRNSSYSTNQVISGIGSTLVKISQNGEYLITGGKDMIARVYKKNNNQYSLIQSFNDSTTQITAVDISSDMTYVLTATFNGTLIIYKNSGTSFQYHQSLNECVNWLRIAKFSSNSLFTGSGQNKVRYYLYDGNHYIYKTTFADATNEVYTLASTQTSSLMVSGSDDLNIRLYQYCLIDYCQRCNQQNICTKCFLGFSLINNTCSCQQGKYISLINFQCVKCSQIYCKVCSQNDVCVNCKNGFQKNTLNKCECEGYINENYDCVKNNESGLTFGYILLIFSVSAIVFVTIILIIVKKIQKCLIQQEQKEENIAVQTTAPKKIQSNQQIKTVTRQIKETQQQFES